MPPPKNYAATGKTSGGASQNKSPQDNNPGRETSQVETVRLWRMTRRPFRIGKRGADLPLAAFGRLDAFRHDADYLWLFHPDGRALALVEGGYFEALRRAAYGHAPVLDPLQLDDCYAAEDDAAAMGARHAE